MRYIHPLVNTCFPDLWVLIYVLLGSRLAPQVPAHIHGYFECHS